MRFLDSKNAFAARWGAYSALPDPLAGFEGRTSKGRAEEEKGRKGTGGEKMDRVPTGQGELEKVRELEWSGKGQGKIYLKSQGK